MRGNHKILIDLVAFVAKAQQSATNVIVYEPDVFPGVRVRICGSKGALTLYRSGQFLVLGMRTIQEAVAMLRTLYPCICHAKIND